MRVHLRNTECTKSVRLESRANSHKIWPITTRWLGEKKMDAKEFAARLSAALREQPPGTAALLGDFAMAVLRNDSLIFQHVEDPYSGVLGDGFALTDELWNERREQLT